MRQTLHLGASTGTPEEPKFSHAKVFVVTGYEHFLQNTTHDIDHVFKKIEDNGDALNKDYVYKILDGFFVK